MDAEEELLQMNIVYEENQGLYKLLLENLISQRYAIFKSLLKRGLDRRPPSININYVYPYPLDKTLLDIACTQGRPDFVQLLLDLGADPNKINESHGRAPIHFATESGHHDVISVLLEDPRTNPNLEASRDTALHFAVRKNDPKCAKVLLENNSSPNIPNSKGTTPLHVAATLSNREMIDLIMKDSRLPPDIDSFVDFRKRCTRDILMEKFPDMELPARGEKNIDFNVLRFYLDANDEDHFLENLAKVEESDLRDGNMLLVLCTERNFYSAVCELLKRKRESRTNWMVPHAALEAAVIRGHYKILEEFSKFGMKIEEDLLLTACNELGAPCRSGIDQSCRLMCLKIILDQPNINVRCEDDKGNTPLHYAAKAENPEAVHLLLKAGSHIGHKNILGFPPIAYMSPSLISEHLNSCLSSSNDRTDEYEIEFDYTCLIPHSVSGNPQEGEHFFTSDYRKNDIVSLEMEPLRYMSQNSGLKHLLKHPIFASFLYLKWHRIRKILYANFVFYLILYVLLNSYVLVMEYEGQNTDEKNLELKDLKENKSDKIILTSWQETNNIWMLTAAFLILFALREILQFLSSPLYYIRSLENWVEIMIIVLGGAVLCGAGPEVGVMVILLSTGELVILIGQHPKMSTSIQMFKTVTINFMKFLFLYAFLILAFALAFFTLFRKSESDNFVNPGSSLFKTIIMLTGEFDANDISFQIYPVMSRIIFILFVFLIAIVLFNLLNGLAVSDTADILGTAELVGLISRTELLSYVERLSVGNNMKLRCGCCLEVPKNRLNFLSFISKRILLFPSYLSSGKLGVRPYKYNEIRIYGKNYKSKSCTCHTMARQIVESAREILTRKNDVSEGEKVMKEMAKIYQRMHRIENILENMEDFLKNSNKKNDED